MCFTILHKSLFSQVNIFIRYPGAAITLTPHTKLTREAEKERLLPWLAPAKTNGLTSEHGVLLDWICLPACLCQSETETKREKEREIWKGRPRKLNSARCSLAIEKRQKEEPEGSEQRAHPSFLFTSSFFTILFTCMADIPSWASKLGESELTVASRSPGSLENS